MAIVVDLKWMLFTKAFWCA